MQIATGTDSYGIVMEKPKVPVLVLFVKRMRDKRLSFLALQMDQNTRINTESCNCRRSNNCKISVIERLHGTLQASRFCSSSDFDGWNLAAIGSSQFSTRPDVVLVKDLRYISVEFASCEERVSFNTKFDHIRRLYMLRLNEWEQDIRRIQMQHMYY